MEQRRQRAGFTLLEIILVLVIIIAVTALSVPVLQSMLADTRMTAAGDIIRARLADARSNAMEEGRPWRLAFIANTGYYQLAPEDSVEWDSPQQSVVAKPDQIRDELPKDVLFVASPDDLVGKREASPAGTMWQTIAVFLPNGTARDDTLTYHGQVGYMPARARLRALTGSVTIEIPSDVKAGMP